MALTLLGRIKAAIEERFREVVVAGDFAAVSFSNRERVTAQETLVSGEPYVEVFFGNVRTRIMAGWMEKTLSVTVTAEVRLAEDPDEADRDGLRLALDAAAAKIDALMFDDGTWSGLAAMTTADQADANGTDKRLDNQGKVVLRYRVRFHHSAENPYAPC